MDYDIAVVPGDGIGPEVIDQALRVLTAAGSRFGFGLKLNEFPYGANHYLKTGVILPESAFSELAACKAILFGAVGDPRVPMGPLEQEFLLAIRFRFDLYVNLRPAKSFPKTKVPINTIPEGQGLDILVVRENTEDFYMGLGGRGLGGFEGSFQAKRRLYGLTGDLKFQAAPNGHPTGPQAGQTAGQAANRPQDEEFAFSLGLLSATGCRRIAAKAFEFAKSRGDKALHVASKANAVPQLYGFWDAKVNEVAANYPDVALKRMNIDNLCYQLPRSPMDFGVILCPNLFGDIVSDLASSLIGGLGLAPSANLGDDFAFFEPVHGSAPDIAGTGKANPLAAILSGALLLRYLGETQAAEAIEGEVQAYLAKGADLPFELGGQTPVEKVGQILTAAISAK
ncbi:MAG: isocitrate/isopropylmalate dehydrogenase family protein [Deltaproteobacteria bacterium]|jgi:3-isopropylmalate dehydrogenase|nr:isocitrate/isopropylmalate dehydrogenase family protein [Deltaproteobacteria bacterium]